MAPKEKFSILLVDDDPMVIRIFSRILADFAPLRFATSGSLALKLARESVPDLVLLDVEMPEFSGFDTCKAFKNDKALESVPILFITAHESPELETVGLKLGGADFIAKPPHSSLVLARVRTYQTLKSLSDTVRSAVTMDFLTGAATRRELERNLTEEWLRAQRSLAPLSLVIVTIDEFAALNVQYGEDAGDAALRAVAEVLRSVAQRPTDLLARHGGASFALMLPATDAAGAAALAARAATALGALQLPWKDDQRIGAKVSVGAATQEFVRGDPDAAGDPAALLANGQASARAAARRVKAGVPECCD